MHIRSAPASDLHLPHIRIPIRSEYTSDLPLPHHINSRIRSAPSSDPLPHQIRIPIMVIDDRKMETAYWRDGNGMDSVIPANSGRTPCKHSKFTTSLQPQATNRQTLQVHPEPATPGNRQANTPSPPRACDPRQQTGKHSKSTTSLRPQAASRPTQLMWRRGVLTPHKERSDASIALSSGASPWDENTAPGKVTPAKNPEKWRRAVVRMHWAPHVGWVHHAYPTPSPRGINKLQTPALLHPPPTCRCWT